MRVISLWLLGLGVVWGQTAEGLFDRGVAEFHQGRYSAARGTFEKMVAESPADARGITFLAITRAALGDCNRASGELKAQASRMSDPEIRKLAGLAFIQCQLPRNEFSEIIPVLTQLRKAFPNDAEVLYEAAKVYNKAWNSAIYELFQKAPGSFRVNQLSAEVFETQGRYGEAAGEYRKAIEKNPAALNLHYRLGRAMLLESHDGGQLAKARAEFDAELRLNPADAAAEYQVGQIYLNEQNPGAAAARFEKAVELAPSFAEGLVALAKLKQGVEAVALLERAVKVQPGMEAAHYNLMLAYRAAGRMAEAQREKAELDKIQRPPEGEFTDFLKKIGDKAKP